MTAYLGPRFGAEAAFIVAVAVGALLLELQTPMLAAAVFAAWLVVAAVEIRASRKEDRGDDEREAAAVPSVAAPEAVPSARLEQPLVEGTETGLGPFDDDEWEPPPPPLPVAPAFQPAVSDSVLQAESPPPPREPVPAQPPAAAFATRTWNLWELERRARERAGHDPLRDQEWSFLLMYLREFADADGILPADFDPLVRESFAELIGAGR